MNYHRLIGTAEATVLSFVIIACFISIAFAELLEWLPKVFLVALLVVVFLFSKSGNIIGGIKESRTALWGWGGAYFAYSIVNSLNTNQFNSPAVGVYYSLQFAASFLVIYIYLDKVFSPGSINLFKALVLCYIAASYLYLIRLDDYRLYSFIFENKNFFGASLLFLYFPFLRSFDNRKTFVGIIIDVLFLVLIYFTGARSSLGCYFIVLMFKYFSPFSFTKRITLVYTLIALVSVFSIIAYVGILESEYYKQINEFSLEYTSSQLASGRNEIWGNILREAESNWSVMAFGNGAGTTYAVLSGKGFLSSHNLFMQVFMQNGLIGVGLFLLYIYSLIKLLSARIDLNDKSGQLVIFYVTLLLVSQNFEVLLFQNNFIFLVLFALSIPLSFSVYRNNS